MGKGGGPNAELPDRRTARVQHCVDRTGRHWTQRVFGAQMEPPQARNRAQNELS